MGDAPLVNVVGDQFLSRGVIAVTKVVVIRLALPADGDRWIDLVATVILPGLSLENGQDRTTAHLTQSLWTDLGL